jgi:hypothetical protein
MCKSITKNGIQCKLQPNNEYCHIHKNNKIIETHTQYYKKIIEYKTKEISNLNKTLEKKIKYYEKLVELKQDEINSLHEELEEKDNKINSMLDYYNKYSQIIEYEIYKKHLIENGIDIYKLNDKTFHEKRKMRNKLTHII